eukprot:CAMPEP_0197846406 /NCGR_PEP_ID=MMETSP1438-20131217/3155_1 /TAXON_ID=1461541 /ORGANISM="Pterosperma sp., Strain CCMP1384" /LENGTH=326 /DNA_ID=CAMNT_0043458047 /DNA_START=93 /DNA_END=1072 /DNA_ORIENTATION=-
MKQRGRVLSAKEQSQCKVAQDIALAIDATELLEKVGSSEDVDTAVKLRMVVTNCEPTAVVDQSREELQACLERLGVWGQVKKGLARGKKTDDFMQQVVRGVWIGCWKPLKEAEALKERNITHVVTVVRQAGLFKLPSDVVRLMIRVDDNPKADLESHLDRVVEFINAGLQAGGGVFVHCGAGVSRSATCVIGYLMAAHKLSMEHALATVAAARPCIRPNDGFMKQLKRYEATLRERENVPRRGTLLVGTEVDLESDSDSKQDEYRLQEDVSSSHHSDVTGVGTKGSTHVSVAAHPSDPRSVGAEVVPAMMSADVSNLDDDDDLLVI